MEYTGNVPGGRVLNWASRAFDRSAPWLAAFCVGLVSVASVGDWTEPLVLIVAGTSTVATFVARRRRWPLFASAVASIILLALWPAPFAASYYAGTSLRRRTEILAYALIAVPVVIVSYVVPLDLGGAARPEGITNRLSILLLMGLGLVAGLWVRARREVLAGLRERAERLEHEQAARSAEARAQERARIAREMHDVVAHRVSLMVLHAGALEVNAPDARTAETADLIRTTGREALANLRDVLGVLRATPAQAETALVPQPDLDDLDRLLDQSRAVGIPVSRRTEGTSRSLPLLVQRTAYRVVQEALTNVHKHADGATTEVALRYLPASLHVVVGNEPRGSRRQRGAAGSAADASPRPDALPGGGYGLVGLRERVELLGGEFTTCARPDGGFVVEARIPAGPVENPEEPA